MSVTQTWWHTRTLREQRLLLALAGLLFVVLSWLLVIRPLNDALAAARERHGAAVLARAEAKERAALGAAPADRTTVDLRGGTLETLLSGSASEAGIPVARVTREGGAQATAVVDAVRPQALFAWVRAMEGRGLIVERLRATANSDQTIAAEITFLAEPDL
jgi:general secretion pathway protein M